MLLSVWPYLRRKFRTLSSLACTVYHGCPFPSPSQEDISRGIQLVTGINILEFNCQLKSLVKVGNLTAARQLFDELPQRDVVTWTNMISGYINTGDFSEALLLFWQMRVEPGLHVDPFILSLTLKACGLSNSVHFGESLHGYSVKINLAGSVYVGSALLDMYMKVGKIRRGCQVFQEMPIRSVVSWTAIITGLVRAGCNKEALAYFSQMLRTDIERDSYVLCIVLKACTESGALDHGREIHCQTIKKGFDENSFVANTLADMYNKCGKLEYGIRLFEMMSIQDVVSWTMCINAYAQRGQLENAVRTFVRMRERGVSPNEFTFAAVISSCASLGRVGWGEQLHAHVTRLGLANHLSVANSIVTVYSRCGKLGLASRMFQGLIRRDIVSWSTIIAGYTQEGYSVEAFERLSQMRREGTRPNEYPLSSVISVCGSIALLEQGNQLHAHVMRAGLEQIALVRSALIDMYAKCGSVKEASKVFCEAQSDDIVSWTAMIKGYAEHGYSQEAIYLFEKLGKVGLRPDSVTFIGVLTACSHAGLVDLGLHYFGSMSKEHGIYPSKEHYGCMIDLLCRAGRLRDAKRMIESMPFQQDDVVWSILLRACRIQGDVDCGRHAADKILEYDPNSAGTLITLANMYAMKGRWREAADTRKTMRSKGVIKERGWSWIKVKDQVCTFASGDGSHPKVEEVHKVLDLLSARPEMP